MEHIFLQTVLPGVSQRVYIKGLVLQKVFFQIRQQGGPAGVMAARYQKLRCTTLKIPVHQVEFILKMVIKGVAPNPGMLHNIVYRNFFQRGGNHQFRQALRQQFLGFVGTGHPFSPFPCSK